MAFALRAIGQVLLPVSDPDRSEAFYEQALGLRKHFRFGDMIHFDCGEVRLYLDKSSEAAPIQAASVLYFRCADIGHARRELEGRGVPFTDQPHRIAAMPDHDLWMTFFGDPDGHPLALMMEAPKGWAP